MLDFICLVKVKENNFILTLQFQSTTLPKGLSVRDPSNASCTTDVPVHVQVTAGNVTLTVCAHVCITDSKMQFQYNLFYFFSRLVVS